jgi:hypothetical protein
MDTKQTVVDLGWSVARLTTQQYYPKFKMEIFSPDS